MAKNPADHATNPGDDHPHGLVELHAPQPFQVELVGNNDVPWFEVLGPLAIVLAAVIATRWARKNHRENLKDANDRLEQELAHDRAMRERAATRDALDAVVAQIVEAVEPMNTAGEDSRELFLVRSATLKTGTDHGLAVAEADARKAVQRLRDLRAGLMGSSFRLHLRFPDTDPIIARLAEWRETFDQLADDYERALDSGDLEMKEAYDTAWETATRLGERLNSFLEAARAWGADSSR